MAAFERVLAEDLESLGQKDEADRLIADANDTIVRVLGEDHPMRIRFLDARAYVAGEAGDFAHAVGYERQATALAERVAPESSRLPLCYGNACAYEEPLGQLDDAIADCKKSIQERTGGQRDPVYMHSLLGLGRAYVLHDEPRDALEPLEHALTVATQTEAASAVAQVAEAEIRFLLARALWTTGDRSRRPGELARVAAAVYERAAKPDDARKVRDWLAEHRLGQGP